MVEFPVRRSAAMLAPVITRRTAAIDAARMIAFLRVAVSVGVLSGGSCGVSLGVVVPKVGMGASGLAGGAAWGGVGWITVSGTETIGAWAAAGVELLKRL